MSALINTLLQNTTANLHDWLLHNEPAYTESNEYVRKFMRGLCASIVHDYNHEQDTSCYERVKLSDTLRFIHKQNDYLKVRRDYMHRIYFCDVDIELLSVVVLEASGNIIKQIPIRTLLNSKCHQFDIPDIYDYCVTKHIFSPHDILVVDSFATPVVLN